MMKLTTWDPRPDECADAAAEAPPAPCLLPGQRRPSNPTPLTRVGIVPTRWRRWKLRLSFALRKRLGPGWERIRRSVRVPFFGGLIRAARLRLEVWQQLRQGRLRFNPPPTADVLQASAVPSVAQGNEKDRVLAEIDQDGFAFATDPRDVSVFNRRLRKLPRRRYRLDVVLRHGKVYLRKQFRRQPLSAGWGVWWYSRLSLLFYTEAVALLRLRDLPGVPSVREIDFRRRALYLDYVQGANLRQLLADSGAVVHDLDLAADPDLSRLRPTERDRREIALYRQVCGDRHRQDARELVLAMHRLGVAPQDVRFGNLLIGGRTDRLYWIDFERARFRPNLHWQREVQTQARLCNDWLGLGLVTPADVETEARRHEEVYSPADLGPLGYLGNVADVEFGEGRWRWLLRDRTDWRGKRLLDLGANNCLYSLRALEAGAREAHCVERDPEACQQATFLRSAIEQTTGRSLDLRLHRGEIAAFLESADFPREHFDITFGLCSMYYLSRAEFEVCMKTIARISRECWLQANIGTPRDSADLREKAGVEFLAEQLRRAGFEDVQLIAPPGYSRPLLIGKKIPPV